MIDPFKGLSENKFLCIVVCYIVQAVSSSVFLWLSSSCARSLLTHSCLIDDCFSCASGNYITLPLIY